MNMNAQLERATLVVAGMSRLPPRKTFHFYDLMAILREPSALFGEPCDKDVDPNAKCPRVDWEELLDVAQQTAAENGMTATSMVEILQVAAEVLEESSLKICRGNPERVDIYAEEMEEPGFSYDLRVDAPHKVARALNDKFILRLIDRDMLRHGFMFGFVGEWTDEELAEIDRFDADIE
ncbi:hypothetical protein ACQ86G_27400 [Roseateles chitinivorans]|uniref:hypothetical protein n=1 Tax=Roseateles chitinivorans TaxID=2917965 RepID=UPI003D674037